jgi:hypothetical protein
LRSSARCRIRTQTIDTAHTGIEPIGGFVKIARWTNVALLAFATTATAALAQPYYEETFDADLGAMIAANDGSASNNWMFDSTCPAAPLAGHSAPGTAHWINPATCLDYGNQGSTDRLTTGRVAVPCDRGVLLEFQYYLDFEESASCDRARVEFSIDGVNYTTVADNGFQGSCVGPQGELRAEAPEGAGGGSGNVGLGNIVNSATWTSLAVQLPGVSQGDLLDVQFFGETTDGVFNIGEGFYVDDVTLSCLQPIQAIPTLGSAGLVGLGALLAVAGALTAARLRRRT